jgi:hypothetical protein
VAAAPLESAGVGAAPALDGTPEGQQPAPALQQQRRSHPLGWIAGCGRSGITARSNSFQFSTFDHTSYFRCPAGSCPSVA